MNKVHALVLVVSLLFFQGGAHAFDSSEQQTINDLQSRIAVLEARLDLYAGSEISAADMAALSWMVVACLAVGFSVRLIKRSL